jgi:hypothetical protein
MGSLGSPKVSEWSRVPFTKMDGSEVSSSTVRGTSRPGSFGSRMSHELNVTAASAAAKDTRKKFFIFAPDLWLFEYLVQIYAPQAGKSLQLEG